MSKKLMTLGLMLTFVWSLGAKNSNVVSPNQGPAKDVSQILPVGGSFAPESDIQIISGYSHRKSYNNTGSSRGTADTLAYDLSWGSYFYMTPGDVMVTAFQMPADGILKGVNVRVYRWGTGDQLTVSLHKLSYPYNADGSIYDQDAVDADGWLGGYDPDGSGGLSIEGTTYTAPGFSGECGKGTVIDGAQDPLGTATGTGPPGTPAMGLIWPDGFTAATLDPTNNPGIDNGGGDNWIALADFGSEPELLQGDWVGVVVHYTGVREMITELDSNTQARRRPVPPGNR
ncbi:MAG: hypothetical protein GXO92_03530 [FCB group bacterium]|nr:hypothetical protein [FCB group bacterium]